MSEKRTQILRLAKKFPSQLIKTIKKGNREEDYINHAVINQRLLQVLGASGWDFEPIFETSPIVQVDSSMQIQEDSTNISLGDTTQLIRFENSYLNILRFKDYKFEKVELINQD